MELDSGTEQYDKPILTIGLPVYNGEQTIKKVIDSILTQSFKNFILVISDNASTDLTENVCKEFVKKDNRIQYIRQEKNIGLLNNWNFLLKNTTTQYFMWIEADDYYDSEFIKKNIEFLESHKNFVGSISNSIYFDGLDKSPQSIKSTGSYENKVLSYLKFNRGTGIFAIYRTKDFQKSMVFDENAVWDLQILLKIIKFGDLNVLDEVLHYKSAKGISSGSLISYVIESKIHISKILFPFWPVTIFCINEFGIKFVFKNFLLFLRLNGNGVVFLAKDFFKFCRNSLTHKK
ncbi:glycosyltransferase family 2 protein [Nitrosopumilus sp. b2]|uniref:glycosyltransferase family 2 protein n=1 Tax=Nitrosopumilus sp. b2 TaxID=2109908 RepID=UPI0015F5AFAB|nr:glycosyltransferase family 2 protein [Nitrosopumilus sp. b2]KAF6245795.1 hypothetical protein C6989_01280 [Nitrosopumilus sp. b2]